MNNLADLLLIVPVFDTWAANRITKSMPISCLGDSIIGIDAAYYLLEGPPKEPLLSALGGSPLALESAIVEELNNLRAIGIKVHFVFDGLDYGTKDDPFGPSVASATKIATAFETYEDCMADQAIQVFRASGTPTPADLSQFLKKTLHKHGIPFTVAPYSSLAQLAYFARHPNQFIDAIYGPSELLLYGVDKFITKFRLAFHPHDGPGRGNGKKAPFNPENSVFDSVDRRSCLEELGRIPSEVFVDSLLLAGSKLLPAFPPLKNSNKGYSIRDVIALVGGSGPSVVNLCNQYPDDANIQRLNYVDRYKQAITSIRHHIAITMEGDIEALDGANAPSDVHDCVGQRLPEELNMYLSRGLIQSRVLNWLASGTILILAPYDGGDSKVFQDLVRVQLEEPRRIALSLLADALNRYYQRKEITTKFWYDPLYVQRMNIKDLLPSPKDALASWKVKEDKETPGLSLGSISFAIRSLQDVDFTAQTVSSQAKGGQKLLKTREEICANAVWRFLQLRGYVDRQHRLTVWGNVLDGMLSKLGYSLEQETAALLAIELLRHGVLNADTMFNQYSGAPFRGSDIDKRNCMLVARVACLGRLIHQSRGYSGPLSRHMLAYHSMISAVQASVRDLVEMSAVTMFLEGYVDRERDDWMDIALTLPFYDEDSCALGVLMLHYFDELLTREDPTSEYTKEEIKAHGRRWVVNGDFKASQEQAYKLWDAVYHGIKLAKEDGEDIRELTMWDDVDHWLSQRR
ncbi:MAG: hypothetical protein Q9179_000022 [Wetmoreana sp. 5 TL-2023]